MDLFKNFDVTQAKDWLELVTLGFAVIGAVVTGTFAIKKGLARSLSSWKERRSKRLLQRQRLQGHYSEGVIHSATRYYIWPKCSSSVDPAHGPEPGLAAFATREDLRSKVDDFLASDEKFLLILADSGTGKTSFLLNYFALNLKRWKPLKIQLVHLGSPDADDMIRKTEQRSSTVLFLDAFDEDTCAIEHGHAHRMKELVDMCEEFSHVVITSRTQFFPSEEEIPRKSGVARIGPRGIGDDGVFEVVRYYISPMSDREVDVYLRLRYPIWRRKARLQALDFALSRIPRLCARPMLLAHIPEIVAENASIKTISDLYEIMVTKWIARESSWVDSVVLREFSEELAYKLFSERVARGGAKISLRELLELVSGWNMSVDVRLLSSRSLLNRDAEDNFKFAHQSILEYLFVSHFCQSATAGDFSVQLSDLSEHFLADAYRLDPRLLAHSRSMGLIMPEIPIKHPDPGSFYLLSHRDRWRIVSDDGKRGWSGPSNLASHPDASALESWIQSYAWQRCIPESFQPAEAYSPLIMYLRGDARILLPGGSCLLGGTVFPDCWTVHQSIIRKR